MNLVSRLAVSGSAPPWAEPTSQAAERAVSPLRLDDTTVSAIAPRLGVHWHTRRLLPPYRRVRQDADFRRTLNRARDGQEAEVAETALTETTVAEVMAELAELEDPKTREVNEKHGDDHGVKLSKLRALAKRLKTQQELASRLWETDDTAARLLAILICRPKAFERDELDVMLREARTPKVHDWLVNYVVKKNPHSEELRLAWSADPDPVVASAGWALTTERVAKKPEGLDLAGLLDVIEAQMKEAPARLQWAMNHCLAEIGIEHPEHRTRAVDIGERLEVLKDYPTSPGCTSPFAPVWITEMVRRQHDT